MIAKLNCQEQLLQSLVSHYLSDLHLVIYRRFYPKRLTIEEYNKRYIIKRQTVTGSACNYNISGIVQKLARQGEVKEREQRDIFLFNFFFKKK